MSSIPLKRDFVHRDKWLYRGISLYTLLSQHGSSTQSGSCWLQDYIVYFQKISSSANLLMFTEILATRYLRSIPPPSQACGDVRPVAYVCYTNWLGVIEARVERSASLKWRHTSYFGTLWKSHCDARTKSSFTWEEATLLPCLWMVWTSGDIEIDLTTDIYMIRIELSYSCSTHGPRSRFIVTFSLCHRLDMNHRLLVTFTCDHSYSIAFNFRL